MLYVHKLSYPWLGLVILNYASNGANIALAAFSPEPSKSNITLTKLTQGATPIPASHLIVEWDGQMGLTAFSVSKYPDIPILSIEFTDILARLPELKLTETIELPDIFVSDSNLFKPLIHSAEIQQITQLYYSLDLIINYSQSTNPVAWLWSCHGTNFTQSDLCIGQSLVFGQDCVVEWMGEAKIDSFKVKLAEHELHPVKIAQAYYSKQSLKDLEAATCRQAGTRNLVSHSNNWSWLFWILVVILILVIIWLLIKNRWS